MRRVHLERILGAFTVHRFDAGTPIPGKLTAASPCWIARTTEELSVVCLSAVELDSPRSESGWAALRVAGPLDFALTGILAGIAGTLAEAGVSLFALSTFDTDYLLVKQEHLSDAVGALREGGYTVDGVA